MALVEFLQASRGFPTSVEVLKFRSLIAGVNLQLASVMHSRYINVRQRNGD